MMASRRGPDYAHDLTDDEQRVLDRLLAAVPSPGSRPAPAPRRPARLRTARQQPARARRLLPIGAGIAVALVLAGVTAVRMLNPAPDETPPPAADPQAVLTRLAAQAAGTAGRSPVGPVLVRRTLEVRATDCTLDAFTATVRVADDAAFQSTPGHLQAGRAEPPAAARALAGCPEPTSTAEPASYNGETPDLHAEWAALGLWGYDSPRGIVDVTQAQDHRPIAALPTDAAALATALRTICAAQNGSERTACWWTRLVEILASPEADTAHRVAALRAAAAQGEADGVPTVTADLTGRPGVTLRVPYAPAPTGQRHSPDSTTSTAELTFNAGTGALLQRVERPLKPTDPTTATVYLAITRDKE